MRVFLYIEFYLWVTFVGVFALANLWALIDVLTRPAAAFLRGGLKSKGYWGGFTAAALVVALLCLPTGRSFLGAHFLIVFPAVISIWYFGSVRPQLPRRRGGLNRGSGPNSPRGTW